MAVFFENSTLETKNPISRPVIFSVIFLASASPKKIAAFFDEIVNKVILAAEIDDCWPASLIANASSVLFSKKSATN